MSTTIATASPNGSLMLWDPKGPVIYWQTTYSEGEGNSFVHFSKTGCVSVRTKPTMIYLFTYENTAPKYKFTAPFSVETAVLHGPAEGCDAEYLFLCGSEGQLGTWNLVTGSLLGVAQLHSRAITTMDVWGNYLLTGSKDGTIALWSLPNILTAIYANKAPQQIAVNTEHAFPLVAVKFDCYVRPNHIVLYSVAEKGHLRRWSLVESSRGFKLTATMSLLVPSMPISMGMGPTGTVLYLLTEQALYSVVVGGPECSLKLASLADGDEDTRSSSAITKVLEVPEAMGSGTVFTTFAASPTTQTIFLGLSTGQVMAFFPGGGFQVYRNKETLPIRNMAVMLHCHRKTVSVNGTKQTTFMQTNLARTPSLKRDLTEPLLQKMEEDGYNMLAFGQLHKETPLSLAPLGFAAVPCSVLTIQKKRARDAGAEVDERLCSLEFLQKELAQLEVDTATPNKKAVSSSAEDQVITTTTRISVSPEEHMALVQRNLELEAKVARLTAQVAKSQLLSEGGYV